MDFTWLQLEEELEIGMNQEASLQDEEYAKMTIEYTSDGLYDLTLHTHTSVRNKVHPNIGFDEVVTLAEGYGLTPDDFLTEEDEDE